MLKEQGKLDEAVACYRRALELKPDYAEAHNNLGNRLEGAGEAGRGGGLLPPGSGTEAGLCQAHSNLLLRLQYCTGVTPAALAEAHADYDRRHAAPLRRHASRQNARRPQSPMRPAAFGLRFARSGAAPGRLFPGPRPGEPRPGTGRDDLLLRPTVKDDLTHRLQAAASEWRDVIGLSDQRLAEQIRADRIDILFDLAGHTGHNRLLVFARKPAPIQVTWAGYVGTTGLTAMDYLLADRYEVPPGAERLLSGAGAANARRLRLL